MDNLEKHSFLCDIGGMCQKCDQTHVIQLAGKVCAIQEESGYCGYCWRILTDWWQKTPEERKALEEYRRLTA